MLLDTPGLERFSNGDPHVWLDPLRYALLVKAIGNALHEPAAAGRLVARLRALDRKYRSGLAHCARRDIVTSHAAFAYLGQRYGLRQIAIEGLNPEGEPAPRELATQLRSLWLLQMTGEPLVPHPYIGPGDEVEILAGSLRGYRGVVLRDKGRFRLVVSITLLRQSVATEIDRDVLAPTALRKVG